MNNMDLEIYHNYFRFRWRLHHHSYKNKLERWRPRCNAWSQKLQS